MKVKIWHQDNPTILTKLREDLTTKYPSLHLFLEDNVYYIRGNFPIFDTNQRLLDEFKIEIKIPNNFPEEVPIVKEIGNKLPKIADRHFYNTGNACLFMLEERHKYLPPGTTIIQFIEGPVKSFFIGQAYFSISKTGKWIFSERPHNMEGIVDYYKNIIGTDDTAVIATFVTYLSKHRIKGRLKCYCGSKKRMSHCHFKTLLKTREYIKPKDVRISLNVITTKFNK